MNEKEKAWHEKYKVDTKKEGFYVEELSPKHVEFEFNDPKDGPGGHFIGFDGRKTKYIGLTMEEKNDWLKRCENSSNMEMEEYIKNCHSEER